MIAGRILLVAATTVSGGTWLLSCPMAFGHEGHNHHQGEGSAPAPAPAQIESQTNLMDRMAVYQEINASYELNVKSIFDQKCAACHSAAENVPWYAHLPWIGRLIEDDRAQAKTHLEISKGFPFGGHGSPIEDLQAIVETTAKDSMPTRLYRTFHSSSRLTADEKKTVTEWCEQSLTELKAAGGKPEDPK